MAKIFVSYRRSDSAPLVGRLCDYLKAYYGAENVFLDIDDIPYGMDFREHVHDVLGKTDAVLTVIGSAWCGVSSTGVRIKESDDPVRVEVESTFDNNVPVLPVLIEGAKMPSGADLPQSLQRMLSLNAVPLTTGLDYHHDLDRLIVALNKLLGSKAPSVGQAAFIRQTLKQPLVWSALAVLTLPFLASSAGVAPPWPSGVQLMAASLQIVAICVVLFSFPRLSQGGVRRLLIAATIALALAGVCYLLAQSALTFQASTTGERFVKGFVCTNDAMLLYKDKCPFLTDDEVRGAEYEAGRLWTAPSIAIARALLDLLWITTLVAIAILGTLGLTIVLQSRRSTHVPNSA